MSVIPTQPEPNLLPRNRWGIWRRPWFVRTSRISLRIPTALLWDLRTRAREHDMEVNDLIVETLVNLNDVIPLPGLVIQPNETENT